MIPYLNNHFKRNFGNNGPRHRSLGFYLPRWYPPPRNRQTPNPINRIQFRQTYIYRTSQWIGFVHETHLFIVQDKKQYIPSRIDHCCAFEKTLRALCIRTFPKAATGTPPDPLPQDFLFPAA